MVVDFVVVFYFGFGFGYRTQGYSPGVRKFGRTKNHRRFFHQYFALRGTSLHCNSGFSFGDFLLAFIQNKKNSGRDRDKFSTVFVRKEKRTPNCD